MKPKGESDRIGPAWLPLAVSGVVLLLALLFDLSEIEWAAIALAAIITVVLQNFGSVASLTVGQGALAVVRRELSHEIEKAKDLAALSVELAAEITMVPFATLDGGLNSQHDAIYGHAYRRLKGMGFSEEEIDAVFSKAAGAIGRRLFFEDLGSLEPGRYSVAISSVLNKFPPDGALFEPEHAIASLIDAGVSDADARRALERYRKWYSSGARVQTFLTMVGQRTKPDAPTAE